MSDTVSPEAASHVERRGDAVYLTGVINPAMRDQLLPMLDGARTLVVTSGGGDGLSAIDIGRAVRARGLQVVVAKACMSSCAHFIFAAARQRFVQSQALVVFHNTSSSVLRMIGPDGEPGARAHLMPIAQAEVAFYREIGLPESLLLQPQIEVATTCFRYVRDATGAIADVQYKSGYRGWIPDRAYVERLGMTFEGWWPATKDEAALAFRQVFVPNAPVFLHFGGSAVLNDAMLNAAYARIGPCTPAEDNR